jgi:hypothetical protein
MPSGPWGCARRRVVQVLRARKVVAENRLLPPVILLSPCLSPPSRPIVSRETSRKWGDRWHFRITANLEPRHTSGESVTSAAMSTGAVCDSTLTRPRPRRERDPVRPIFPTFGSDPLSWLFHVKHLRGDPRRYFRSARCQKPRYLSRGSVTALQQ